MAVCRVCLADAPDRHLDELKTSKKDGHKDYSDIFEFCLGIQIMEHTEITRKLCTKCFKKILNFYKFKSMALKNDAYLKSVSPEDIIKIELQLEPCDDVKYAASESDLDKDVLKGAVKTEYESAEYCMKRNFEEELSEDVKNETVVDSEDEILSDVKAVKASYLKCGRLPSSEDNCVLENPIYTTTTVVSKVKRKYTKHKKIRAEPEVKRTKSKNGHWTYKREVCGVCGKNVINLKLHSLVHIPKQIREKFPCQQCDKVFLTSAALNVHHNIKHLGILGHCDICNKDYVCLSTHQLIKHNRDKLKVQCGICKVRFLTQSMLDTHMTHHTKEKPFQCDHCGKNFSTKMMVTTHIRSVHEHIKNFVCHHCSRPFFQKSHLKSHLRTHTKEKPFKCSMCDKTFPANRDLINHQYSHRTVKEFQCKICSMSFLRPGYLHAHMLSHSNEKKFLCRYCGIGFKRKDPCKKHEYKKHLKNMESNNLKTNNHGGDQ